MLELPLAPFSSAGNPTKPGGAYSQGSARWSVALKHPLTLRLEADVSGEKSASLGTDRAQATPPPPPPPRPKRVYLGVSPKENSPLFFF